MIKTKERNIKLNDKSFEAISQERIEKMLEKVEFIFDNGKNGESLVLYGIAFGMAIGNSKRATA